MKIYPLLLLFVFSSCAIAPIASRPELKEVNNASTRQNLCSEMFVQEACQLVHSINFTMANGYGATLLGVIVIDGRKIKTTLMGVEGFVLFAADQGEDKEITVRKSLAPFDKPEFAKGLMRDVRTLFIVPEYAELILGETENKETVCRYVEEGGRAIDVSVAKNGYSRISIYDKEGRRERLIRAEKHKMVNGLSFAESVELTFFGIGAYTLQLKLLRAERSHL